MVKVDKCWNLVLVVTAISTTAAFAGSLAWASPGSTTAKPKPKLVRQAGVMDDGTATRLQPAINNQSRVHAAPVPHYPKVESTPTRRQIYKLNMPLKGGIEENVPYTPEEVTNYLIKMRAIVQRCRMLAAQGNLDASGLMNVMMNLQSHQQDFLSMTKRIRVTIPPRDLKETHNDLAIALGEITEVMINPQSVLSGGDPTTEIVGRSENLDRALSHYHVAVKDCIAYYRLSDDLDPFRGEAHGTNVVSTIEKTKEFTQGNGGGLSGLMGGLGGAGGNSAQPSGMPSMSDLMKILGSLGGLGGGSSSSAGAAGQSGGLGDLGQLGGLGALGGSGNQSLESIDVNELMKQLGGSGIDPNSLNSILQGLGN